MNRFFLKRISSLLFLLDWSKWSNGQLIKSLNVCLWNSLKQTELDKKKTINFRNFDVFLNEYLLIHDNWLNASLFWFVATKIHFWATKLTIVAFVVNFSHSCDCCIILTIFCFLLSTCFSVNYLPTQSFVGETQYYI